jgi:hypothetical protein
MVPAEYDGRTVFESCAYICAGHFEKCGVGTGYAKGQRILVTLIESCNYYSKGRVEPLFNAKFTSYIAISLCCLEAYLLADLP